MIDFWGESIKKDFIVMPWGHPSPSCPGCHGLPKTIPQTHKCTVLGGLLTTARANCSFCDEEQGSNSTARTSTPITNHTPKSAPGKADLSKPLYPRNVERAPTQDRGLEWNAVNAEIKTIEEGNAFGGKLLIKAVVNQARMEVDAELEAEEVKAWAEVEAREAEAKVSRSGLLSGEQDRKTAAEIEARVFEFEARALEAEEQRRQTEAFLRHETAQRALAEERVNEIERETKRQLDLARADFEDSIAKILAETRNHEELNASRLYQQTRIEIEKFREDARARIDAEVKMRLEAVQAKEEAEIGAREAAAETGRVEEIYKTEIAQIRAEAEANIREAETRVLQADAQVRMMEENYKPKVNNAMASIQASMLLTEEAQKKADEMEAKCIEMEIRAEKAEDLRRQAEAYGEATRIEFEAEIAQIEAEAKISSEQIADEIVGLTNGNRARIQAEVKMRLDAERTKAEVETKLREAEEITRQVEENYKAQIIMIEAEAKAKVQQIEERCQNKIEEVLASAQTAMLANEEAQKKIVEIEARYRELRIACAKTLCTIEEVNKVFTKSSSNADHTTFGQREEPRG